MSGTSVGLLPGTSPKRYFSGNIVQRDSAMLFIPSSNLPSSLAQNRSLELLIAVNGRGIHSDDRLVSLFP